MQVGDWETDRGRRGIGVVISNVRAHSSVIYFERHKRCTHPVGAEERKAFAASPTIITWPWHRMARRHTAQRPNYILFTRQCKHSRETRIMLLHLARTHADTYTKTDRRTDRQTDRQTDGQTDRQTGRKTDRQTLSLSLSTHTRTH